MVWSLIEPYVDKLNASNETFGVYRRDTAHEETSIDTRFMNNSIGKLSIINVNQAIQRILDRLDQIIIV